ncbi:helix-turn-helix domain-containing protein [Streptomyces sp. NPDC049887]|uniref:helix-turn-helix domain-containing protein n=1 Tax=Streptomyces sp. NPDC049887 TaxID=3155654 RepID=UPI0034398B3A
MICPRVGNRAHIPTSALPPSVGPQEGHEQLAALAGTSRETRTKVLRGTEERGLLRLARGGNTVLDRERFQDAAG